MNFSSIQKITDEEYDGDLDTYENKVKLYKRLDKELEGTDRVFLKILKNDIKELKPIDDYTEYLTDQWRNTIGKLNKIITPTMMRKTLVVKALMMMGRSYISKSLWKDF